jgi:hypothetical protein
MVWQGSGDEDNIWSFGVLEGADLPILQYSRCYPSLYHENFPSNALDIIGNKDFSKGRSIERPYKQAVHDDRNYFR